MMCLICVLKFFSDADDVDTWMLDMLRLVSSEDVGHDEASVQSLTKKHKVCLKFVLSRYSGGGDGGDDDDVDDDDDDDDM